MSMLIGVSGGSGSGKSTLARRLVADLGPDLATSISFDSYYRDHSQLSVHERAAVNFDHPDSLDADLLVSHLQALKQDQEIAVPVYDFATHTRSGDLEMVAAHHFIIIEGILLFSFEVIREQLDVLVFRDCPEDVRKARRFTRDIRDRGRTPESVEAQWAATVKPMHDVYVGPCAAYADIVTDHDQELDDVVTSIADRLRAGGSQLARPTEPSAG